ncbi:DUF6932 family protein [Gilvimarinus sp. F26214L]|uniref:DUF6932 family protein n=1 Tax=Gilvimarinus sp. DZF01 TaxID=3461371 RepID=UPI0040459B64
MDELLFSRYGTLLPRNEPYELDLSEIRYAFGRGNHARRNVFEGLAAGVDNMFASGVKRIILGGSFISRKREPRDVDVAWWYDPAINWSVLDPVFQLPERRAARAKFLMDQKIDGVLEVPYEQSHEYFLRWNTRLPEDQEVGIVRVRV